MYTPTMKLMANSLLDHKYGRRFNRFQTLAPVPTRNVPFDDIGMSAFSVFFVQPLSFLNHRNRFHETHNRSAC